MRPPTCLRHCALGPLTLSALAWCSAPPHPRVAPSSCAPDITSPSHSTSVRALPPSKGLSGPHPSLKSSLQYPHPGAPVLSKLPEHCSASLSPLPEWGRALAGPLLGQGTRGPTPPPRQGFPSHPSKPGQVGGHQLAWASSQGWVWVSCCGHWRPGT